jgi:hypothetical protein
MRIDIPFGVKILEIGAITIYTLKLRFNSATYSWIKPELDSCDPVDQESIRVTEHNGYKTIRLETNSYNMQESVWKAIQRGQVAQQEYALERWKEYGIRTDAS